MSCHGAGRWARTARHLLPPVVADEWRGLAASRSSSSSAARWAASTACCQPRGKNEESDPNSIRSGPSTASAWRNTSTRRRPGVYFVQAFELDVSTWRLGQRSAAMRVSRKKPAPKWGTTTGTSGNADATGTRASDRGAPAVLACRRDIAAPGRRAVGPGRARARDQRQCVRRGARLLLTPEYGTLEREPIATHFAGGGVLVDHAPGSAASDG